MNRSEQRKNEQSKKIASPCVDNCCLNDEDICLGCYRHLDEITTWSISSNEEKLAIIRQCCERKKAAQQK